MTIKTYGDNKDLYQPAQSCSLISAFTAQYRMKISQRSHDVYTTSAQRRCNVMTLHRRWGDVVLRSCARWVTFDSDHTMWMCRLFWSCAVLRVVADSHYRLHHFHDIHDTSWSELVGYVKHILYFIKSLTRQSQHQKTRIQTILFSYFFEKNKATFHVDPLGMSSLIFSPSIKYIMSSAVNLNDALMISLWSSSKDTQI